MQMSRWFRWLHRGSCPQSRIYWKGWCLVTWLHRPQIRPALSMRVRMARGVVGAPKFPVFRLEPKIGIFCFRVVETRPKIRTENRQRLWRGDLMSWDLQVPGRDFGTLFKNPAPGRRGWDSIVPGWDGTGTYNKISGAPQKVKHAKMMASQMLWKAHMFPNALCKTALL